MFSLFILSISAALSAFSFFIASSFVFLRLFISSFKLLTNASLLFGWAGTVGVFVAFNKLAAVGFVAVGQANRNENILLIFYI